MFLMCTPLLSLQAQINETPISQSDISSTNLVASTVETTVEMVEESPTQTELATAFSIEQIEASSTTPDSSMYTQGVLDANRFYPKKSTGAGGTFCTSFLLSPILGLIPAIACASKEPSVANMGYPDAQLMKDPEYLRGYTETAHALKKKKVWGAYGAGAGAYFLVVALAYSQQ